MPSSLFDVFTGIEIVAIAGILMAQVLNTIDNTYLNFKL